MKNVFEVKLSIEKEVVKLVEAESKEVATQWVINSEKRKSGFIQVLKTTTIKYQ